LQDLTPLGPQSSVAGGCITPPWARDRAGLGRIRVARSLVAGGGDLWLIDRAAASCRHGGEMCASARLTVVSRHVFQPSAQLIQRCRDVSGGGRSCDAACGSSSQLCGTARPDPVRSRARLIPGKTSELGCRFARLESRALRTRCTECSLGHPRRLTCRDLPLTSTICSSGVSRSRSTCNRRV
jgi:hypothetical protein